MKLISEVVDVKCCKSEQCESGFQGPPSLHDLQINFFYLSTNVQLPSATQNLSKKKAPHLRGFTAFGGNHVPVTRYRPHLLRIVINLFSTSLRVGKEMIRVDTSTKNRLLYRFPRSKVTCFSKKKLQSRKVHNLAHHTCVSTLILSCPCPCNLIFLPNLTKINRDLACTIVGSCYLRNLRY